MAALTQEELDRFAADHPEMDWIDAAFIDFQGHPRGKRLPRAEWGKLVKGDVRITGSNLISLPIGDIPEVDGYGWYDGDPDNFCYGVSGTLAPQPWDETGKTGQVMLTMHHADGRAHENSPAAMLERVEQALLTDLGLRADVAVELEFYLVDKKNDRQGQPRRAINPSTGQPERDPQVYNIGTYDGFDPVLREIERCCTAQGLDVEGSVCEFGGGQFEVNLRHSVGATMAVHEAMALIRTVKRVASRQGFRATFMSKPFDGDAGNGMHIHASLVDQDGNNIFAGKQVGETLKHAIGGVLETLYEGMLIFAPSPHAWRRLEPHMFVPMGKFWAVENRSVLARVPQLSDKDKRIEHRIAGADANPYFAMAAVLAGMHYGLKNQIDPGPEASGNASLDWQDGMPRTFLDALDTHKGSQILRPMIGEEIWDRYYKVKREELNWYLAERSPVEARWYLNPIG